jgi:hypothetical protein
MFFLIKLAGDSSEKQVYFYEVLFFYFLPYFSFKRFKRGGKKLDWLDYSFWPIMIILVCLFLKRAVSWIRFIRNVEEYSKNNYPQIKVQTIKEIKDNPNKYVLCFKSYYGHLYYLDKETNQVYLYLKYYNEVKPHGKLRETIK